MKQSLACPEDTSCLIVSYLGVEQAQWLWKQLLLRVIEAFVALSPYPMKATAMSYHRKILFKYNNSTLPIRTTGSQNLSLM